MAQISGVRKIVMHFRMVCLSLDRHRRALVLWGYDLILGRLCSDFGGRKIVMPIRLARLSSDPLRGDSVLVGSDLSDLVLGRLGPIWGGTKIATPFKNMMRGAN